jgi:outer membrane protein assembly factor BamB
MPQRRQPVTDSFRHLAVMGLSLAVMASTGCARGNKADKPASTDAPVPSKATEAKPADPMLALGYRSEWTGYPQVDARAGIKFISVLGDAVVVHDNRNIMTLMEPGTGRNRWSLDLGSPLMKFVGNAREGDNLYACSESEVQVLDVRTGQIKARQKLAALANTHPVVKDGIAVFGCSNGEALGHSLVTGYKVWAYKLGGTVTADPVVVGNSVAVVSQAGDVIILEPKSGESLGRRRSIFAGLTNHPVANENNIFIAGTDQSVWAISGDGKLSWRVRTPDPLTAQPAVYENSVIVSVPSAGMSAFDASSGAKLWATPGVAGDVVGIRNGRLVVWDRAAGSLLTLDAKRGDVIDRAPVPSATTITTDAFIDGNLYIGNKDGSVDKRSPR